MDYTTSHSPQAFCRVDPGAALARSDDLVGDDHLEDGLDDTREVADHKHHHDGG